MFQTLSRSSSRSLPAIHRCPSSSGQFLLLPSGPAQVSQGPLVTPPIILAPILTTGIVQGPLPALPSSQGLGAGKGASGEPPVGCGTSTLAGSATSFNCGQPSPRQGKEATVLVAQRTSSGSLDCPPGSTVRQAAPSRWLTAHRILIRFSFRGCFFSEVPGIVFL